MSPALCARNVSKYFRRVPVLDGLDLEIPEGSVFGLIGPNGAGKTTTIKILMNILQPTSGHAEVLGVDSRRIGPAHFEQIGYVSENQEMPGWMTVDYLLAYLRPFYPTWDEARAAELVRQFQLPRNRQLRHLSRGMWMKASLASSLAYRPRLLVLDEPFSGLDPLVREDLHPEAAPALVRFVETRFDPEQTTSEIRRLFGDVRQVSVNPMPLRTIFLTLARYMSKPA
jgi:ABC-2 type transport system ATP-binding protein